MTSNDDLHIHQSSRRHFADVVGLGRGTNLTLRGLIFLTTSWAMVASYWAWHEALVSASRVERYVVYLDPTSMPVGKTAVSAGWTPVAGTYLDFAKRWVRQLRGRPLDINTLKFQRAEVIHATDPKLYSQLGESMKAADDQVRKAAVDVDEISANLLKLENDTAIVAVRWRETVRQAGADPVTWNSTLKIVYVEPKVTGQFERNVLGLYASEFQITRES